MPDERDCIDEAPEPAEDLGLPTPPSPGRVPPPPDDEAPSGGTAPTVGPDLLARGRFDGRR